MKMQVIYSIQVAVLSILVLFALELNADFNVTAIDMYESTHHKLTLKERLEIEKTTIHWLPYKRILFTELQGGEIVELCLEDRPRAIEEFPEGWWTREERLKGRFVIHIFVAVYLFIALAFICDKYFLPTVEVICQKLNLTQDVAASTFMATATTIPEFFANTISTFVADSDMGLSAIIGSMLFNTLGVAACASLFTKKPIQIDWYPITRDSIIFSFNISVLVVMAWDGVIMWWETIILLCLYVAYWVFMFQNPRVMKFVKGIVEDRLMWCQRIKNYDIANQRPFDHKPTVYIVENGGTTSAQIQSMDQAANGNQISNGNRESYKGFENHGFDDSVHYKQGRRQSTDAIDEIVQYKRDSRKSSGAISQSGQYKQDRRQSTDGIDDPAQYKRDRRQSTDLTVVYEAEDDEDFKVWEIPRTTKFELFWYFFTWPIRFLLHYTIPSPIKYPKWFVAAFIMCIVWIAVISYLIFWMVIILGDVFNIPEAVMGLTFLAFGGCMPEAITAVIVARQGSGQMGVSNALGANSLAILFSLGVPWFIRTMASGAGWTDARIRIFSHGIEFTIMGLLLAVAVLYVSISMAGYKLRKKVGAVLSIGYLLVASFAILVELDVFFEASDRC